MIFTQDSIIKIREGRKTQTRRIWKVTHVKIGGVYRVRPNRFASFDTKAPVIRVTGIHVEPLGSITEEDAHREGVPSVEEFKRIWVAIHHDWHDEDRVHVVDFELAREC